MITAMCERVAAAKKKLKSDAESQTLKMLFVWSSLQYYFSEFTKAHDEAKLIDILQKDLAQKCQRPVIRLR